MSAFTPGPWVIVGDNLDATIVRAGDGIATHIAKLHDQWICEEHGGTVRGNARLIAAAPDLLAACIEAAKLAWEVGCESEDGILTLLDDSRGDLYRQLSAAIAKARGES